MALEYSNEQNEVSGESKLRELFEDVETSDQVNLIKTLALFDGREPRTTKEVEAILNVSHRTALDQLEQLHARGILDRKQTKDGTVIWWRL